VLGETTNQVKPKGGMYQVVTQVNVLSLVIFNIIEVDVLIITEDNMIAYVKVSKQLLCRGLRQ